ncbi:hypothetical protein [Cellulomonas hominis]|uniref:hypothetical protein n=1 Tax=Cellulomonas hominis TaxID=156981 RepID=UPI001B9D4E09|nr:hypothetical protein [Cellulomonas hominis]VTR76050.1 hypothetical protein CHMI_00806 [Cellulomonas hominis]
MDRLPRAHQEVDARLSDELRRNGFLAVAGLGAIALALLTVTTWHLVLADPAAVLGSTATRDPAFSLVNTVALLMVLAGVACLTTGVFGRTLARARATRAHDRLEELAAIEAQRRRGRPWSWLFGRGC